MRRTILFLLSIVILSLLAGSAPAQFRATQPVGTDPLSLQQLNLLLRTSVGRNMTEADLATIVQRNGLAFELTPEIASRLRANGAHPNLMNAIRRASERSSPGATSSGPDPVIEDVRKIVRDYLEDLPDFICQEEITRYADNGTGAWQKLDMLSYELTYNRKRESYKPINSLGRPTTRPLEESGGAYSTGDFATALAVLFQPDTNATFKAAGKDKLGTREALVYDFRVPQPTSKLTIRSEGAQPIIAGYSGSVWIDAKTKQVLRIEQAADNLPADYPVTQAETIVDYDMVKLRGIDVDFLLPTRAEFTIADRRQHQYSRNMIYFKFYRKFETDIKIVDEPTGTPPKP
jgi:hypothetical protein